MPNKNIFGGYGLKAQFMNLIYQELMKREYVTLADILCLHYGREKNYYEKKTCSSEIGYGELKKAFPEVIRAIEKAHPGSVVDNGKTRKERLFGMLARMMIPWQKSVRPLCRSLWRIT